MALPNPFLESPAPEEAPAEETGERLPNPFIGKPQPTPEEVQAGLPGQVDNTPLYTYDQNNNLIETRVIDGDTIDIGGVKHRALGGNTAEAPKLIEGSGVFNPGGVWGSAQTELVRDAIKAGRVRVIPSGEQDAYGRELSRFEFVDTKQDVMDYFVSEGLADVSVDGLKYSTGADKSKALRKLQDQVQRRSAEELRDSINFFQDNLESEQIIKAKFDSLIADNYAGPLELASNKEEFDKMEYYRSYEGQQQLTDSIKQLQEALEADPENAELQAQLDETKSIAQAWALAPQTYYGYNGAAFTPNKGYFGQTLDSLDAGLSGLQLTGNNLMIWSGDLIESVGIETSLDELGQEWADENLKDIMEASRGRVTWEDVKGLDASVGTYLQFASNTIFEFGPQLALLVGASAIHPAGGLAMAYGMATGEVHGAFEEGERNPYLTAAVALPMAALDALVPGKVANPLQANMLTKAGRNYVYGTIMQSRKVTYPVAKKMFQEQSKELMEDMVLSIDDLVTQNFIAKKGIKDFLIETAQTSGSEAITEGLQEAYQTGAVDILDGTKEFSWDATLEAMVAGVVIGGIAASPLGAISGARQNAQFNQVLFEYEQDQSKADRIEKIAERIKEQYGSGATIEDIGKSWKAKELEGFNMEEHSIDALTDGRTYDHWENFKDNWNRPWNLVLKSFKQRITEDLDANSTTIHEDELALAVMLNNVKGAHGNQNLGAMQNRLRNNFLKDLTPNFRLKEMAAVKNDNELYALRSQDPDTLTPGQREAVDLMRKEEASMMEKIVKEGRKFGVISEEEAKTYTSDFLDKWKFIDPDTIDGEFVDILAQKIHEQKNPKSMGLGSILDRAVGRAEQDIQQASRDEALEFINEYRRDPYSTSRIDFLETIGAFESPQFGKYQNHNPRYNAAVFAGKMSRRIPEEGIFGRSNENLAKILYSMKQRGVPEAKIQQTARMLNTLRQSQNGTYKVSDKPGMQVYSFLQNNALLASQVTMMDTNIFANFSDLMYNAMRLEKGQVKDYVYNFARSFAVSQYQNFQVLGKKDKQLLKKREDEGLEILHNTGHISDIDEIVQIEGTDIRGSKLNQEISSTLYKLNLVASLNDASRAAAAQNAVADILGLAQLAASKPGTAAGRQAKRRLINYNISPDYVIKLMENPVINKIITDPRTRDGYDQFTKVLEEQGLDYELNPEEIFEIDLKIGKDAREFFENIQDFYNTATANYIDEFAARPEKGTGSLLQEDPRFRIFTQYTRFIQHFTTNQIPTLWSIYLRKGSPEMKFRMFSNIAMTMMLATMGQYIKMIIQYGEIPEWFEDEDEDFANSFTRHSIAYSGYGGTPELLYDKYNRIMQNKWTDNPLANIGEVLADLSPVLSKTKQGIGAYQQGELAEWGEKQIPLWGDIVPNRNWGETDRDFLGDRI